MGVGRKEFGRRGFSRRSWLSKLGKMLEFRVLLWFLFCFRFVVDFVST